MVTYIQRIILSLPTSAGRLCFQTCYWEAVVGGEFIFSNPSMHVCIHPQNPTSSQKEEGTWLAVLFFPWVLSVSAFKDNSLCVAVSVTNPISVLCVCMSVCVCVFGICAQLCCQLVLKGGKQQPYPLTGQRPRGTEHQAGSQWPGKSTTGPQQLEQVWYTLCILLNEVLQSTAVRDFHCKLQCNESNYNISQSDCKDEIVAQNWLYLDN